MRLIIHAPNVHQGGGRVLVSALLNAISERPDVLAIVDLRLDELEAGQQRIIDMRVPPTPWGRFSAERRLRTLANENTAILCFGNLPPLFRSRGRALLFLQNRYLTGGLPVKGLPWRVRSRIAAERWWLRGRIANVDEIIVQSQSMARDVARTLGRSVKVLPFAPDVNRPLHDAPLGSRGHTQQFDFIYVASGEPHKNHDLLLESWKVLAAEGIKPSLCLTLDPELSPDLVARIEEVAASNALHIENIGQASGERIHALYRSARALIYPSIGESLGLPLLEAAESGLPIVAAERDYVRDVVEPAETFDPMSAVSIARAVRRFLKNPAPVQKILTPGQFLEAICSD